MQQKKTLYDILEIPPHATYLEIRTAYQKLTAYLESGQHGLTHEEIDIRLKLIKQAYGTLSVDFSRSAYDASMFRRNAPQQPPEHGPIRTEVAIQGTGWVSLRLLLKIIASLMAMGLLIQLCYMMLAYRQVDSVISGSGKPDAVSHAEEKVILQEYYQEHGIRPGTTIEANMLEAEERRKEQEQLAKEREQQEKEREYQRFVDESRRIGDRVSADLHEAEERASREAEYKRQQEEIAEQNRKEEELARIEREKQRWHDELYK